MKVGADYPEHSEARRGQLFLALWLYARNVTCNANGARAMKDISGMKYGKLVAVKSDGKGHGGRTRWLCKCDCGGFGYYYKNNLDHGRNHCGCEANTKPNLQHGMRNHELYGVWNSMINRCENTKNKDYPEYGGRGIRVCKRWHDVCAFIEDMHPRPKGASIDRIDVNGDYEPTNCRWADNKAQRWNQRKPCKIFPSGMSVSQLAKHQKIKVATIRMRMHRGWSDEEIENGERSSKK